MSDKEFLSGRKEKSLLGWSRQTGPSGHFPPGLCSPYHTHLCRVSLSSGCRASWPIRPAGSAPRGTAIRSERSVRQRPPGHEPFPFPAGLLFQPGSVDSFTENRTAAERTHRPDLDPKPAEAGSAVGHACDSELRNSSERFSLPRKSN